MPSRARNRGRDRCPPKISSQNAQLNGCAARRYAGSIIYHWAPFLWFALWLVAERMLAKNWKVKILDHLVLLRQACQRHRWVIEMLAKQTPALKAMYFYLLLVLLYWYARVRMLKCIVWSFFFVVFMPDGPQCSGRSDRDLGNKQWQVPYSHILYLYQRGRSRMSDGDVRWHWINRAMPATPLYLLPLWLALVLLHTSFARDLLVRQKGRNPLSNVVLVLIMPYNCLWPSALSFAFLLLMLKIWWCNNQTRGT